MITHAEPGVLVERLARWSRHTALMSRVSGDVGHVTDCLSDTAILKRIETAIAQTLLEVGIFSEVIPLTEEDFDEWVDYLQADLIIGEPAD